ncbi:feruloyl-CoA synthase [Roseicella aerolata]|uniref:Feruloyl-CoA synthase n=1 Tax=Roseicella aerolata TaxID=2883479 RepID=A0A9X1IFR7_9PROT|nr:feruloyl-CoA synthase [Roseicella aerolata]MCB4823366.1 feruloyl-CoA synthase [Roseicella aerolata]
MPPHPPGTAPLFAPARMERRPLPGGGWLLRSRDPLAPHAPRVMDWLWHWERAAPDRPFLRERGPDGAWRGVCFGEAAQVRALGAALLARGLGPRRPLAILSGNSVRHALLALAAQAVGVPVTPVSPPYALQSDDFGKLRHILRRLRPGLLFAEEAAPFARALAVEEAQGVEVTTAADWDALLATPVTAATEAAIEALDPDGLAKLLFTSGSTGLPKGVRTTHRMMAANQQQILQVWPFLAEEPPVLLDWLPWSHVFGGSHNLNLVLRFGGTLWIDEGRPMPGPFDRTLANLREVAPTLRFDVPRGHALLLPALEADAALARHVFSRLRLLFSAGAALAAPHHRRLQALAEAHAPRPVPVISAWGMTETAPAATIAQAEDAPPGGIGTPLPGVELKLLPVDGKIELRLRGPNLFAGYHEEPEATAAAFDEEGFFRTGDAVAWVAEDDPGQGLRFDGRLVEDFKLSTGTRINALELRLRALSALGGLVRDVVVVGADRDDVGLLVFPADPGAVDAAWRERLREALRAMNAAAGGGSSRRVARAMVLAEPPSLDAGEVTDKGSLNVRAIQARRAGALARLYDNDDPEVMTP